MMVLASHAHAENPRLNLQIANGRLIEQLIPVPSEDSYDCETPSTPAQIVFSENLKPFNFNPTPFYQTGITSQVTVRRSGQVEQDQLDEDLQARFSDTHDSSERWAEITDLSLNMTLSVCTHEWFLDFVRADYVITGQIGQFRVDHHEALAPGTGSALSLNYTGRNSSFDDGGQFLKVPFMYNRPDDARGIIHMRLNLPAVPFEHVDGDAQLLVDMTTFRTGIVITATDQN